MLCMDWRDEPGLSVCSPNTVAQKPFRNALKGWNSTCIHILLCAYMYIREYTCYPNFVVFLFPLPLCLLLVYSNDLIEVRVAGSSCVWDVPVFQHCSLFLFSCQLLLVLTSMNSQPFRLLLCNNSAPTTWSFSCMVLLCWRLSNYIAWDIALCICEFLLKCSFPGNRWMHTQGAVVPYKDECPHVQLRDNLGY